MLKKKTTKLTLNKATLRVLADKELVEARGGAPVGNTQSICSFCNGECTEIP